jgi:hypothetical protein
MNEALRANLQRRKAQMRARAEENEAPEADTGGVRYSGFAVRDKSQTTPD